MGILVIGGDGLVGSAFLNAARAGGRLVRATSRRPLPGADFLDLADVPERWEPPEGVKVALICAAMTSLEACRKDPALSRRVNIEGPERLARAVQKAGGSVIFLSSSLVFGAGGDLPSVGTPVAPLTEYGNQKALGEAAVLGSGRSAAVVRLTKVVHPRLGLFEGWLQALRAGKAIEPFDDMVFCPVGIEHVVSCLIALVENFEGGCFHVTGTEDVSYARAARWLAGICGASVDLVRARSHREAGIEFSPQHTRLLPHLPGACSPVVPDSRETLQCLFQEMIL